MTPYKGMEFNHRRWLDSQNGKPLKCRVTRIAQGQVYYRPIYGKHDDGSDWLGAPAYFPVSDTAKYVEATS